VNYLALCKRLRQEAGYSGNGPASVDGQSGEMQRVIDWIAQAWTEIQVMRKDWRFKLSPFSISMTSGETQKLISLDMRDLKSDSIMVQRADGSRTYPLHVSIEELRKYRREQDSPQTYPFIVAQENGLIEVYPDLGEDVTIQGEYYRAPEVLTNNTDVPDLPEAYHLLIVWGALMQLASYDEAGNLYQRAAENYAKMLSTLNGEYLPTMMQAKPLA
jgi:tetratricopeptide (TPR) repeat protein